jgi:spore coat polysaccharide biosynthesis protein SpsF
MTRAIFITARTSSKRLPRKCLLEVANKQKAIEFLIDRLDKRGYFIVLCTSTSPDDNELVEVARRKNVAIFRGSEEDKLKRWIDCAKLYNIEFFVTADGDDLFIEPELIELAFEQYRHYWYGFIKCTSTPSGSFSWGIERRALERVYKNNVKNTMNTEMGFCWFDDVHELTNIPQEYLRKDVRMTLDYQEDLDFFRKVISEIGNVSLKDILVYLDAHKDVININIARETDWKNNQQNQIGKIK